MCILLVFLTYVFSRPDSVKNAEKFLPLSEIRKTLRKMVVSEDVLRLADKTGFLGIDRADDWGKKNSCLHWGRL